MPDPGLAGRAVVPVTRLAWLAVLAAACGAEVGPAGGDGPSPRGDGAAIDGVVVGGDDYARHLALIKAQPWRNHAHDDSPFAATPQDALDISDGSPLLGPREDYVRGVNGNPEPDFPTLEGGQNRTACEFSHFAYDDPLVAPGQPGVAHLHMFFGNTDVNAYSTHDTLKNSGSGTCNGQELNRTGYWAPAMFDGDGNVRIPERVVVYYKGEGLANGARNPGGGARPYVAGMANISPNPDTVAEVDSGAGGAIGEVNFKCSNNFSAYPYASGVGEIPTCSGDYWQDTYGAPYPETRTVLEMEVKFWNCFPRAAEPTDWRAWQPAGPTRGGWFYSNCSGAGGGDPADADVYPNLSYFINYVVAPGEDTSGWYLSSDVASTVAAGEPATFVGPRGGTHHADWWGGWHPDINREWIENCVNHAVDGQASGCGFGYLSDGGPDGDHPRPGRALRMRPQYDRVGDPATMKIPAADVYEALCRPLDPAHDAADPRAAAWCVPERRR